MGSPPLDRVVTVPELTWTVGAPWCWSCDALDAGLREDPTRCSECGTELRPLVADDMAADNGSGDHDA